MISKDEANKIFKERKNYLRQQNNFVREYACNNEHYKNKQFFDDQGNQKPHALFYFLPQTMDVEKTFSENFDDFLSFLKTDLLKGNKYKIEENEIAFSSILLRKGKFEEPTAFINFFEDGRFEMIFGEAEMKRSNDTFALSNIEREVVTICSAVFKKYNITLPPPFEILYQFLKIKDKKIYIPPSIADLDPKEPIICTKDELPSEKDGISTTIECVLPIQEEEIGTLFKPLFDKVWKSIDQPQSPNYDEKGKWQK